MNTKQSLWATVRAAGLVAPMALIVTVVSCGGSNTESQTAQSPPPVAPVTRNTPSLPTQRAPTPQEEFLARIKNASRSNGVIRDARMNSDNELGVVISEGVKLREIRPLMQTLTREMRDTFPNRVLTIRAYTPNGQQLAMMRHDPSAPRGRDTTFTPAPGLK